MIQKFSVDKWIDSLHEDANGMVWTTKSELRALAVEAYGTVVRAFEAEPSIDVDTVKELLDALQAVLGTMDFYFGPNARALSDPTRYNRVLAAYKSVKNQFE